MVRGDTLEKSFKNDKESVDIYTYGCCNFCNYCKWK